MEPFIGFGPPQFFYFFKIVGIIKVYLEFEPIETKLCPPYSFFNPLNPKNIPNLFPKKKKAQITTTKINLNSPNSNKKFINKPIV